MQILTLTILFIILTAPVGAILMATFGPILCRKEVKIKLSLEERKEKKISEEDLL